MNDIVDKAKTARTNLAEALSLLQSPEAGNLIDSVAEPVARAMGALHQIETTAGVGVSEKAPVARDAVRSALAVLQTAPETATTERVTEIIAASLGLLHGLAQAAEPDASVGTATTEKFATFDRTQLSSEPIDPALREPAAVKAPGVMASEPAPAAPSGGLDMTLPLPARAQPSTPAGEFASTQASIQDRLAAAAQTTSVPPAPPEVERRNSKHASMPPEAVFDGALSIEANLGAHSPTNFYKGLSGNDVVDDGGLFISTYEIPPLGTKLKLVVNMPGGYDFLAVAVVKWTRESGVGDAPPGFGCSFTNISQEARQLIYRYVRNREPLFHDDF